MSDVIRQARAENRDQLFEHEVLALWAEQGLAVAPHRFFASQSALTDGDLESFFGAPAYLKVVSPRIVHKTDVGAVVRLPVVTAAAVHGQMRRIEAGLPSELRASIRGWLVSAEVPFEPGLGHELLFGTRDSEEFGPIVTLGFGGTYAETLQAALRPEQQTLILHPELSRPEQVLLDLQQRLFFRWLTGQVRGVAGLTTVDAFWGDLQRWLAAIAAIRLEAAGQGCLLAEFECNPLVWSAGWVPVDARARLAPLPLPAVPVPRDNLRCGLHPRSVAVLGVSTRVNMGRIILRCLLEAGYPSERVTIIRPDTTEIDGVHCVARVADLAAPVDLLILAIGAERVPAVLAEIFAAGCARAVLLIPGGMGETVVGRPLERAVQQLLQAQPGPDRPVLIGNNSLGIVSRPDRLDTLFIPKEKLPRYPQEPTSPVALISQSGAYMITRVNKLPTCLPAYQVSLGNQIDVCLSDVVDVLAEDPQLTTFALYVEGFRPNDGRRLLVRLAERVAAGCDVILYKAGRTPLGQAATAGHTASLAGDYRLCAELFGAVGVMVADTFDDFLDLILLSVTLHRKRFTGCRLAMMSNAGYESVGMADHLRTAGVDLKPAVFQPHTVACIRAALTQARIADLVTVTNPLDITPMADDSVHAACLQALLEDPGVDAVVAGNVPLTPNVASLPAGLSDQDVFDLPNGYAQRVVRLAAAYDKPFALVVDSGPHYDAMFRYLQQAQLPVFRSADRAVRLFGRYLATRCPDRL